MRVKITASKVFTSLGRKGPQDVIDVPESEARSYIDQGRAIPLDPPKVHKVVTEPAPVKKKKKKKRAKR